MSDVTSSSGPVRLEDLQRILSNIEPGGINSDLRFGLGDIFRPDLIMPLMGTLPVEERLASYLPEVLKTGQIDLSQFGVDPSKYRFTVSSFLEALEDSVTKAEDSRPESRNEPMDESH
ncbi:unnamed protein product [Linum tenue]|uniref:Uncharacterized protein n=1 Tax=Linum tenue TaxID=586396 RepID=A0AAV0RAG0_9ROSI|nr:unnamed protein product [Linum tenue]